MKNIKKIIIGVIVIALIGAGIYFGNTKLQKGSFVISPKNPTPVYTIGKKKGNNVLLYIDVVDKSGNKLTNAYVNTWTLTDFISGEAKCFNTTPTDYNTNIAVLEIQPFHIVNFEAFSKKQAAESECKKPIYFSMGWKNFPNKDVIGKLCKVWSAQPEKKLEPCINTLKLAVE